MEDVKSYLNKSLYGLSDSEFSNKLSTGIDVDLDDSIAKIEWALLLLDLPASPIRHSEATNSGFSLRKYDGCHILGKRMGGGDLHFINYQKEKDIDISLFDNEIDIKVLNMNTGFDNEKTIQMLRFKSLPLVEKRGIMRPNEVGVNFFHSILFEGDKWLNHAQTYKLVNALEIKETRDAVKKYLDEVGIKPGVDVKIGDKTYSYEGVIKMLFRKEYLYPVASKSGYSIVNPDDYAKGKDYWDVHNCYKMALSAAFTFHYEWTVYIRENEKSVGFRVPIDPYNAKEVFALRDLKEGDNRKSAICHFVRNHLRTIPTNKTTQEERAVWVRKHLRGETKFNWRGLEVHITPSKSDIINTKTKKKFLTT